MNDKALYMQIKNKIKEQISSGKFESGDKIPSERELCEMFDVSRITVRRAISEAINDGLLFTVQGKGTFVADKDDTIDQTLTEITPFGNTIAERGLLAGTSILSYQIRSVDVALSRVLNLDITDQIVSLNLLGTADDEPVVYYESYFQADVGKKFYQAALEKEKECEAFSTIDLYEEIVDEESLSIEQTFQALAAELRIAEILGINTGEPLFLVSSIVYIGDEEKPIEYKKAFYRADKYKFHIKREIF